MAAQPFGDGQRRRERKNPRRAGRPDERRERRPNAVSSAKPAGKPITAKGISQAKVLASTRKAIPIQ